MNGPGGMDLESGKTFTQKNDRVPHISRAFREMWGGDRRSPLLAPAGPQSECGRSHISRNAREIWGTLLGGKEARVICNIA